MCLKHAQKKSRHENKTSKLKKDKKIFLRPLILAGKITNKILKNEHQPEIFLDANSKCENPRQKLKTLHSPKHDF